MPLTWLIGLLVGASLLSFFRDVPMWISVVLFSLAILSIVAFLFCYFFCLFKNPDLIRSEKYCTTKLMIESGLMGDDAEQISGQDTTDTEFELVTDESKKEIEKR